MPADDTCRFEQFVKLPRDDAFALLADNLSVWWAPVSGDACLQDAALEPHAGGACYESTAEYGHLTWGTVLSISKPLYIRLAWQVTSEGKPIRDPAAASRVMITFREAAGGTRLEVVHSDFIRHGEDASASFAAVSGPNGWQARLERLQVAALQTRL